MNSVHSKKSGNKSVQTQKPPINPPQHTLKIALRFTIKPAEEPERYVPILDDTIKQVETIISGSK